MIKEIIEIEKHQITSMEYKYGRGKPKAIMHENGKAIGYMWFHKSGRTMKLDMIEIIDKEQGIGTATIDYVFNHLEIDNIQGQVLVEPSMRAYYFWESLGAEFFHPEIDDIEKAYSENISIFFDLKKIS